MKNYPENIKKIFKKLISFKNLLKFGKKFKSFLSVPPISYIFKIADNALLDTTSLRVASTIAEPNLQLTLI